MALRFCDGSRIGETTNYNTRCDIVLAIDAPRTLIALVGGRVGGQRNHWIVPHCSPQTVLSHGMVCGAPSSPFELKFFLLMDHARIVVSVVHAGVVQVGVVRGVNVQAAPTVIGRSRLNSGFLWSRRSGSNRQPAVYKSSNRAGIDTGQRPRFPEFSAFQPLCSWLCYPGLSVAVRQCAPWWLSQWLSSARPCAPPLSAHMFPGGCQDDQ
jgi:hypothetical protein